MVAFDENNTGHHGAQHIAAGRSLRQLPLLSSRRTGIVSAVSQSQTYQFFAYVHPLSLLRTMLNTAAAIQHLENWLSQRSILAAVALSTNWLVGLFSAGIALAGIFGDHHFYFDIAIKSSALGPPPIVLPSFGFALWGWGPISVILMSLEWPSIPFYTFLYTFSSSVTHAPFVREMPAFCTTLYSVILSQTVALIMKNASQICVNLCFKFLLPKGDI